MASFVRRPALRLSHRPPNLSHRLVLAVSVLSLALLALATPLSLVPPAFSRDALPPPAARVAPPPPASRRRLQAAPASASAPHRDANIAYFIQVSEATAWHLPRLVHRIHHPRNVYAVHFDKKLDPRVVADVTRAVFARSPAFARNVFFMKPELITYRGVSMLLNTISAMEQLLDRPEPWDYFINISGSDYPLVSPHAQRALLGTHVKHAFNFVTYTPKDKWGINIAYRMAHFYVDEALTFTDSSTSVRQLDQQNPLASTLRFQYTNAEAWMINSRDFCRFVVTSGYARKMLLTFAFSVESSEHYFSTLLWNHPKFNQTIVPHALRHVVWFHEGRRSGQHPFYVDEVADDGSFTFQDVVEKSPNFFIRKFKNPDSPLMDFIDRRWNDPTALQLARSHYTWRTSTAMQQHASKTAAGFV